MMEDAHEAYRTQVMPPRMDQQWAKDKHLNQAEFTALQKDISPEALTNWKTGKKIPMNGWASKMRAWDERGKHGYG